jgi:DNA-binding transcriptional ArsR family regulator
MSALAIDVVHGPERAAALLDPVRLRILEGLAEPDSAAGVARRLGLPRQRVNYHLHELEKHELVSFVEERRKGNCVERIVRATARSYVVSPATLGALAADPARVQDRFSLAYLVAVSARTINELAVLRARAEQAGKKVATLTVDTEVRFANAAARHSFAEELTAAVTRLVAKYHDDTTPDGRTFRLVAGAYPAITKPEETSAPAPKPRLE